MPRNNHAVPYMSPDYTVSYYNEYVGGFLAVVLVGKRVPLVGSVVSFVHVHRRWRYCVEGIVVYSFRSRLVRLNTISLSMERI